MPRVTITITDKQPQPYRFPVEREAVSLGRSSDNDICIKSESVSVHHAKMHRVPGGYELRDLGSTNGLKVEGKKMIFVKLRNGMTVRIGEADFHFQLSDEELETLAGEVEDAGEGEESAAFGQEGSEKSRAKLAVPQNAAPISPVMPRSSSGMGGGAIVMLLILAAIAFFVGMMIRFQKETGTSLIDALRSAPLAGESKGSSNGTQED